MPAAVGFSEDKVGEEIDAKSPFLLHTVQGKSLDSLRLELTEN